MHPRGLEDNCFGWWIGADSQEFPLSSDESSNTPDADVGIQKIGSCSDNTVNQTDGNGPIKTSTTTQVQAASKVHEEISLLHGRERRDSGFDDDGSNGVSEIKKQKSLTSGLCYTPERLVKSNDFRILVPRSSSPRNTADIEAQIFACSCCCCCCRSQLVHLHRPLQKSCRQTSDDQCTEVEGKRPLGVNRNDDRAGAADLEALLEKGAFLHDTELGRPTIRTPSRSIQSKNLDTPNGESINSCCCHCLHHSKKVNVQDESYEARIKFNDQILRRLSNTSCGCHIRSTSELALDDQRDTGSFCRVKQCQIKSERENDANCPSKSCSDFVDPQQLHSSNQMHAESRSEQLPVTDEIQNGFRVQDDMFLDEQNGCSSASRKTDGATGTVTKTNEDLHISEGSPVNLEPLGKRLRGLRDSNGSIVDDLAVLRADFSREEQKLDHLLDDTRKLRNEVNELRYLDDLLNLLNGKLENISKRSWPFTVRHRRLKNEELNLII
ncbi:hypothetical protein QAD02_000932 [Eretmocerus hayati]|uniref:Uncharacterized protein n=1 Tax=Eretmocerus hayati TaxID=131215 RepID=A0ACC2NFG0_9HYME|nr:hypothetical protein QAD02_000932 [Eretmocerus hayati]